MRRSGGWRVGGSVLRHPPLMYSAVEISSKVHRPGGGAEIEKMDWVHFFIYRAYDIINFKKWGHGPRPLLVLQWPYTLRNKLISLLIVVF